MSKSLNELSIASGIKLPEGEVYLGGRIHSNGALEHSVVIAFNDERLPLEGQREWAKSIGGVLMNRFEGLVIYNEHRDLVKEAAYWTDEVCEWDSSYAWYQNFIDGCQNDIRKSAALRAVAVRRLVLQ